MALSAVSGLVLACSDMIEEEDASAFLDLLDRIPFGLLMMMASELRGIAIRLRLLPACCISLRGAQHR